MRPECQNCLTRIERKAGVVKKEYKSHAFASFLLLTGEDLGIFVLSSSFGIAVTCSSVTDEDCRNKAAAKTLENDSTEIRTLYTLMPSQTYLFS